MKHFNWNELTRDKSKQNGLIKVKQVFDGVGCVYHLDLIYKKVDEEKKNKRN